MGNSESSRFGKTTTAKEVVDAYNSDGITLAGKTAIVTGGNSGIGLEACKVLAHAGAKVIMCSRSVEAGQRAIEEEVKTPGHGGYAVENPDITVKQLDLSSLKSVKTFADDIIANVERIDYLILNAGVMAVMERKQTVDGFEMQIGVNHFGHFYLTNLLLPKLKAQSHRSRIVVLASDAHRFGSVDLNDLHFDKGRKYSPFGSYGQSKEANILFAKSLADNHSEDGKITAVSVHPGVIATNLMQHYNPDKSTWFYSAFKYFVVDKTIPQGAATTLYGCLAPELEEHGGSYLLDCGMANEKLTTAAADVDGKKRAALWQLTQEQIDAAVAKIEW